MSQFYTANDHFVLLPALMLCLFGSAILLFDLSVRTPKQRRWLLFFTLVGLLFTGIALWRQQTFIGGQELGRLAAFRGALVLDRFSLFFNWLFLAASAITAIVSFKFLEREGESVGEFYGLLLIAQSGMFFLAGGADLITLFVGLEVMAVCFYVLVGFMRADKRSNEAAMKYLLLGAFSSAFLLYGFSLLYGLSGSTQLREVAAALNERGADDPIAFLAMLTTLVGLLFKIAAVPFHMWAPDAYEGAPTPVTAYLSVASKAAAFAFLLRLLLGPLSGLRAAWEPMILGAALLSLTVGNLAALTQTNVKRLLAYSSISHAGYILLGLVAGNDTGIHGVLVYLLVYTFMNLGAFLIIAALRRPDAPAEQVDDLSGLFHQHKWYAVSMLVMLLSLAGIPPTAGFLGKYYIFLALIQSGHFVLAAIAALYVAVALYYYFRLVRSMWVGGWSGDTSITRGLAFYTGVAATLIMTAGIGLYPEPFLGFARVLRGQ